MHLSWGHRLSDDHVGSLSLTFTSFLACLSTCFLHDYLSPISQADSHDVEEEEKEERNSNLSAQHFLPGNPQRQAFPCPTSVDRKWSWILAEGQLWCPRTYESRVRAGVGMGAAQEQIDEWFFWETKLRIADLSADMSFMKEIKRPSQCSHKGREQRGRANLVAAICRSPRLSPRCLHYSLSFCSYSLCAVFYHILENECVYMETSSIKTLFCAK